MPDEQNLREAHLKATLHILSLISQEKEPRKLADLTYSLNNLKNHFSDTL
jgi:hypothetical protein